MNSKQKSVREPCMLRSRSAPLRKPAPHTQWFPYQLVCIARRPQYGWCSQSTIRTEYIVASAMFDGRRRHGEPPLQRALKRKAWSNDQHEHAKQATRNQLDIMTLNAIQNSDSIVPCTDPMVSKTTVAANRETQMASRNNESVTTWL
jgi:hypothetical protein